MDTYGILNSHVRSLSLVDEMFERSDTQGVMYYRGTVAFAGIIDKDKYKDSIRPLTAYELDVHHHASARRNPVDIREMELVD